MQRNCNSPLMSCLRVRSPALTCLSSLKATDSITMSQTGLSQVAPDTLPLEHTLGNSAVFFYWMGGPKSLQRKGTQVGTFTKNSLRDQTVPPPPHLAPQTLIGISWNAPVEIVVQPCLAPSLSAGISSSQPEDRNYTLGFCAF